MKALFYPVQPVLIKLMLENFLRKYNFPPHMIFNETGYSTVTNTPQVIAESGSKQIGQVTSDELGILVTTLFFINAAGCL